MAINWQELTHNRPLMIGLAGAMGLGAFVWYRNRNASSSASSTGTGTSTPQGVADTTSTDVASWLSSYGQQLQTTLEALQAKQSTTGTTGTGGTSTTPTTHYGLVKTKGDTAKNWGWFTAQHASLGGIATKYKISLADLRALNPGLSTSGYLPADTKVKLSSDVGPWQK